MVGDSDGQLKKQTSMFLLLGKNDGGWCVCYAKVHSQLYATANITAQLNATMCASASASASASAAASASASKNTDCFRSIALFINYYVDIHQLRITNAFNKHIYLKLDLYSICYGRERLIGEAAPHQPKKKISYGDYAIFLRQIR